MTDGLKVVVECPDCGHARLAPREITVRGCVDSGNWTYRFTCPTCQLRTTGDSARSALQAAVAAGSPFETWSMPAVLREIPDGPPFTAEDELAFHELLTSADWFEEVVGCDLDADR